MPPTKSKSKTSSTKRKVVHKEKEVHSASFSSVTTFSSSPQGTTQTHFEIINNKGKINGLFEKKKNNKIIEHKTIKNKQDLKKLLTRNKK